MPDLIVIGAGGCGLMAALVGAERGADVLVLEKTDRPGGGTALSHRALRAAGTRFQRDLGIEDSPELYAEEIRRRNSGQGDPELTKSLTEVSSRMVEFLADGAGVDFYIDEFTFGQAVPRSHAWRGAKPITDFLHESVADREDVEIRFGTRVRSLVASDGSVTGVDAGGETIAAGKVILASGGFGGSRRLLERYIPQARNVAFPGHEGSTGDGIEMGLALGAATRHMDAFQPYPAHVGPGKVGVPPGVIMSGGIVVDASGTRFVDETGYPGGLARAILDLDGRAYEIFDERIYQEHLNMTGARSIEAMHQQGKLVSGRTASELATALGISAIGLEETIEDRATAAGGVDSLGREVGRPLEAPFYGIPVRVALYHTQGGLAVDRFGRVLREDGTIVPNLYAGGGAASGVSGDGMDGYLPGNGLLASLGLGYITAEHAVATLRGADLGE